MGWATFWAIFFKNSSGHPDFNPITATLKLLMAFSDKSKMLNRKEKSNFFEKSLFATFFCV
jgi:hypothetical protein